MVVIPRERQERGAGDQHSSPYLSGGQFFRGDQVVDGALADPKQEGGFRLGVQQGVFNGALWQNVSPNKKGRPH